ncbi:DEAD/DEAH box helicase [Neomegalonema perideroedes]|uniref:DEAD/DEAH box helicase n=1 Tax=Neomegalonema perideroedes TaxID=217219 RepID=UPI00035D6D38|nr:AAA domain-containing protein [Neomegalonema perideroedes]
MKLGDFPYLSRELARFSCESPPQGWRKGEPVQVAPQDGRYLIRQGDLLCVGAPVERPEQIRLQAHGDSTLWSLADRRGDVLLLQTLSLVEEMALDLTIAVEEAVVEHLRDKQEIAQATPERALIWLKAQFVMEVGEKNRVLIDGFEDASTDSFKMMGAKWQAVIRREAGALRLKRVSRLREPRGRPAAILGAIRFQDASVAAVLQSPDQVALLDAALRGDGGYLQSWRRYGELEWSKARRRAETLGALPFTRGERPEEDREGAWFLRVEAAALQDFRRRWREAGFSEASADMELTEEMPDFFGLSEEEGPARRGAGERMFGAIRFQDGGVVFQTAEGADAPDPPQTGFLSYSLSGDHAVKSRREVAWRLIQRGSRLPQLHYILEGLNPPSAARPKIQGVSRAALACFKGPPTPRQQLALEVALNTPDLALIVGPPGTGKTQVIAALQRRLAETFGEEEMRHQVLVSSFQHDAVDNALERSKVFGLPGLKIGGRRRGAEARADQIDKWRMETSREIGERVEEIRRKDPLAEKLIELERRIAAMKLARMAPEARRKGFEEIDGRLAELDQAGLRLSGAAALDWRRFLAAEREEALRLDQARDARLIRSARALRTSASGFADDGAERVRRLARELRGAKIPLGHEDRERLEDLGERETAAPEELLGLAAFRDALIDQLSPDRRILPSRQALTEEALKMLSEIERGIETPLRRSRRGVFGVLNAYCAALDQAPDEAKRALTEYASTVGATCQQAAGRAMADVKSLSAQALPRDGVSFDTVIVDEAARANPLDLFIPMSMASRRIVLVGDHRQLPQLIQQHLEDELVAERGLTDEQAETAERNLYRKSLFERLLGQLRAQERADGVRRVVMLDEQYRMHPTLGAFISAQFYESEGLDPVRSGRPASDFAHEIPGYEGRCAAWLDAPLREGEKGAVRSGSSWIREVEAREIAREVKRLADACGPDLSIGAISFYKAQSDCILRAFEKQGLATRENGELRIAEGYARTSAGDERLRVGTADAFQGKEFDVTFLSLVRSARPASSESPDPEERELRLRTRYGHLRLANRMNVAMSRQRKLLVVVGDRAMAEGAEAEEGVPALAAFLRLCLEERRRSVHGS